MDTALYSALWDPQSRGMPSTDSGQPSLKFTYDPFQDVVEIAAALRIDPVVAQLGSIGIQPEPANCSAWTILPPPPLHVTVTEWHNTVLDHYFLSSTDAENATIASGGAGPGWQLTGETFIAAPADPCRHISRVFRFYTPGANSHFYTVDAAECGGLRTTNSGWIGEGIAFGATMPVNGACATGETPLYRLYNNRWMYNDSNHRYTVNPTIYQQMMSKGWIGEGVAMCIGQVN